jgi:antitoxin (DNA-binding transcriptional repressor) of toxin-antitoxin stability system
VIDEVHELDIEVVITKNSQPIVKLIPFEKQRKPLFGCMRGTVKINGDIVNTNFFN